MPEATCAIDEFGPLPVVRPGSVAELGELIRSTTGQALYPVAGRTELDLGNAPTKPGLAVDLTALTQVIDFPARDMTVTVQAGIAIAELQALLTPENLRLPIDVPLASRATLGGILATNVSGPRRLGYGTLRDYVIGISALNDQGNEFKAGGRVVKNVAGYDICKLLVGSLGTLGIITQVTLKLRPGSERQALLTLPCPQARLEELLQKIQASRTRPIALEVLSTSAANLLGLPTGAEWTVVVGYDGNETVVDWQVKQLGTELAEFSPQPANEALWSGLTEWNRRTETPVSVKASLLPSRLVGFLSEVDGSRALVRAHAGNGIVTAHLSSEAAAAWRQSVSKAQGFLVVTRCPPALKGTLSVWGPPPRDADLMRKVKAQFDPAGRFNPGRFTGGI